LQLKKKKQLTSSDVKRIVNENSAELIEKNVTQSSSFKSFVTTLVEPATLSIIDLVTAETSKIEEKMNGFLKENDKVVDSSNAKKKIKTKPKLIANCPENSDSSNSDYSMMKKRIISKTIIIILFRQ
jgi:6-phosphogluconate dehydrogenase (decarboxylating)